MVRTMPKAGNNAHLSFICVKTKVELRHIRVFVERAAFHPNMGRIEIGYGVLRKALPLNSSSRERKLLPQGDEI